MDPIRTARLAALAIALTSVACAHQAPAPTPHASPAPPRPAQQAPTVPGAGPSERMTMPCPMSVPGTAVAAEDTATGETLTFTTSHDDQVAELRQRVRAMAQLHEQRHATGGASAPGAGAAMGGMGFGGGTAGTHGGVLRPPASHAEYVEVPEGARIVLTPVDPADLAALQSVVRMHAEELQDHGCAGGATPAG